MSDSLKAYSHRKSCDATFKGQTSVARGAQTAPYLVLAFGTLCRPIIAPVDDRQTPQTRSRPSMGSSSFDFTLTNASTRCQVITL
ncbi:unnamed protein product [Protopolystoma xenopodis]|uniref:Uncharacterized protein n=1 Tax=Protopolystoma xenopodis TaxID=117903 RepID=A0A3S5B315_9PLAT|nr:unnamed protein product [Protopolystoma xenopodis]